MRSATANGAVQHRQMPGLDAGSPTWMGLFAFGMMLIAIWLIPADLNGVKTLARFFSGSGNVAFLVVGYAALLMASLYKRAWGNMRVIATTLLMVTLLVHVQKFGFGAWLARPSGSAGGFPSGHAAAAYALAFLLALYFPRWAALGYGMAVAISWSRVPMSDHWSYQVVVGSITGYLLALLLTDRVVKCSWQHRLAKTWPSIIVIIIPIAANGYSQHEYENHPVLIAGALLPILFGMALRLQQYRQRSHLTATTERRRHRMQHLANAFICTGVTFGAEVIWLVPLEVLTCLVVFMLAERVYQAQSGKTDDSPLMGLPDVTPKRPGVFLVFQYPWVREVAWGLLMLLPVIKECIW